MQELAEELGKSPTSVEMNEHGRYSKQPFQNEFGTWNNAVEAAGLEVGKRSRDGVVYPTLECEWCGKEYQKRPSKAERSRFCSVECRDGFKTTWTGENNPRENAGELVTITCEWCGIDFDVIPAREETARFCSYDCTGEHHRDVRSGEDSPNWKGGKEVYYGPNWRKQRGRALERDGYVCQRCDKTRQESLDKHNKGLDVHHIVPLSTFKTENEFDYESANALSNLISLCVVCHTKIESPHNDVELDKEIVKAL